MLLIFVSFFLMDLCSGAPPTEPTYFGCPLFTPENAFRMTVTDWQVHPASSIGIAHLNESVGGAGIGPGCTGTVWAGSRGGHPINWVDSSKVGLSTVTFDGIHAFGTARFPIPLPPPLALLPWEAYSPLWYQLEGWPNPAGAWDSHLLIIDNRTCVAHELYIFRNFAGQGYVAGGSNSWNMSTTNTSFNKNAGAEAAGLPMFCGSYRYSEVFEDGVILHALRAASNSLRNTFVWPAVHSDGRALDWQGNITGNNSRAIPMGARLRLRLNVSLDRLGKAARVIATAMKLYGIQFGDSMVSGWGTDGVPDARWNDTDLKTLRLLKPTDFDWVWPPFLPKPAAPPTPATSAPATQAPCSIKTDCSDHATGVIQNPAMTPRSCQCACRNYWQGAACDVCPSGYTGTDCNTCPVGTLKPLCRACSPTTDCSNRAITVTASSDATQCQCVCRNQWGSKNCSSCNATKYSGTDCDRCDTGLINYPSCVSNAPYNQTDDNIKCQAKCRADNCTNSSAVRVNGEPTCSCSGCPTAKRVCALPCAPPCNTPPGNKTTSCMYPVNKCQLMGTALKCVLTIGGVSKWYNCGAC